MYLGHMHPRPLHQLGYSEKLRRVFMLRRCIHRNQTGARGVDQAKIAAKACIGGGWLQVRCSTEHLSEPVFECRTTRVV